MAVETTREESASREVPLLRVRNLQTAFFTEKETIRAVDGISFDIHEGETLGLVGESGSGKSVTARSLMGLVERPGRILKGSSVRFSHLDTVTEFAKKFSKRTVDIDSVRDQHDPADWVARSDTDATPGQFGYDDPSQVTIEDLLGAGYGDELGITNKNDCVFVTKENGEITGGFVELTRVSGEAQRLIRGGRIAMIFQDPLTSLNPVYTVGNQIKEALKLHQGIKGEEATKEAAKLLEDVGIPDARRRIKEYPHEFSGGMRQRAVIAMALACEPEVLICDEPTTALDVTIQAQILDLLDDLKESRDLAILFITHDMGVIADISDRVNVMYAGEIVETAGVEALFANPKHPYTQGLLKSIPGQGAGDRLATIEGNVPTPNEPATHCRFAPRCPRAFEDCDAVHPVNVQVDDDTEDHTAACLLYPEQLSTERAVEYHRQRNKKKAEDNNE